MDRSRSCRRWEHWVGHHGSCLFSGRRGSCHPRDMRRSVRDTFCRLLTHSPARRRVIELRPTLIESAGPTSQEQSMPIPPDDLKRNLTVARPNENQSLVHVAIAGGTYTILITGADTAGRYCL